MKLSQLLSMVPSLQALSALKLPVKASFRVAKITNMIQSDLTAYDASRTALLNELGALDETKTSYSFTSENGVKFSEAMQQLVDEECALVFPALTLSDLGTIEIEPMHLAALADLITDDSV